jgi:hypothetical protein
VVDVSALRGAVSREVGAPISEVYAAVADLTQMGRWSPECRGGEWLDGADRAEPGARLRGHNRFRWMRWSRIVEVTVAQPPHTLEFRTLPGRILRDSCLWRYRFEPVTPTTTLVTESFQALRGPSWYIRAIDTAAGRDWADPTPGMRTTLQRLDRALAGDDGHPTAPPPDAASAP